jgi:hypothetical protein
MTLYQLTFIENPLQNCNIISESKRRMVVNEDNENDDEESGRGLF